MTGHTAWAQPSRPAPRAASSEMLVSIFRNCWHRAASCRDTGMGSYQQIIHWAKGPLYVDSRRPLKRLKCVNTGHCPRARRTGQIDPKRPRTVTALVPEPGSVLDQNASEGLLC